VRRVIPGVERLVRVDLRVVSLTIPPQEVISRDNVPARVNAVVLFRVIDPIKSVMEVENHAVATSQITQTTLRSLLGREDLDTLLAHREDLHERLREQIALVVFPLTTRHCGALPQQHDAKRRRSGHDQWRLASSCHSITELSASVIAIATTDADKSAVTRL
jgi:SPFH domain / Band 7 family